MSRTWFTSDTHLGHANIVGYCQRPFGDVDEMDRVIVERWNERVAPDDEVWHLGDFCMGPRTNIRRYFDQLNGHKFLVRGNHDRSAKIMSEHFAIVQGETHISLPRENTYGCVVVWLRHRPPSTDAWRKTGATYALHGHVHNAYRRRGDLINVGVDAHDFRPVSLQELLETPDEGVKLTLDDTQKDV